MHSEFYEVTEKDFILSEEEMMDEAFGGYYEYKYERGRSEGLESIFKKDRFCDEFYEYNFLWRCFYWFKTFVCLSLGRIMGCDYSDINVVYFDEHYAGGEYGGTSWTTLAVGEGLFKNWYVGVFEDSSC